MTLQAQIYMKDGLVAFYQFDGNGGDASEYHNDAYRVEGAVADGITGLPGTALLIDNGQTVRVASSSSLSSFGNTVIPQELRQKC